MRILIWGTLTLALLWGGYWFVGASQLEKALVANLDDKSHGSVSTSYSDIAVRGFPNRFDTTLTDLEIESHDEPVTWSIPFLQILALSYNPGHLIAVWSQDQSVTLPDQVIDLNVESLQASAVFENITRINLARATLVGGAMKFRSSADWGIDVASLSTSLRQKNIPETYDLALDTTGISVPDLGLSANEALNADARITVELARPLDRDLDSQQAVKSISVSRVQITQGDSTINVTGELPVDDFGVMDGELTVQVSNWQKILMRLTSAEVLPTDVADNLTTLINLFALDPNDPDNLNLVISIKQGNAFFGPIPLGTVPKLVWN
ncbi:MAG: DUF2125 domain-containing protein [Litoreibacter sp.]